MCWMYDHPEASAQDYLDVLRTKMRKNGWAVQYVESDRIPFAYTIGLHDWGLPELLVTGVSPPRASRLLNGVARDALRGLSLTPGSQIKVEAGPLIEIVDVDHPDAHMGWAIESGGPDVRARQLVWADGRGRWPWSAAFCDGRRRQPVLGVRARQLPERRL
jgi:Domain of unknown function (DUF4262)